MSIEIFLVEGSVLYPGIGDGKLQRGVGVGKDGDPLVGVHGIGIVHVGGDVNLLHPNLCEPEADSACHVSSPAEGSGLRVAAPEQYCIAVFGNVFNYVVLLVLLSERVHAPDMLGAPIPAFPAVGLAGLQGKPAAQIE